jgi:hypothetical protein
MGGLLVILMSDGALFSAGGVDRMRLGAGQAKRLIGVIIDQQGGSKSFSPSPWLTARLLADRPGV